MLVRSPLGGLLRSPLGGLANACCCNDTQCCCLPVRLSAEERPPLHITITGAIEGSGDIPVGGGSPEECASWHGTIPVAMSPSCDAGWEFVEVTVECLRNTDGIHELRVTVVGGGAACATGEFQEIEAENCVPIYWRGRWGVEELFAGGCGSCLGDVFRVTVTE